jgi:beta-N-acetylhexosaminidase
MNNFRLGQFMRVATRSTAAMVAVFSLVFAPANVARAQQTSTHLRSPLSKIAVAMAAAMTTAGDVTPDGKLPVFKPYTRRPSREAVQWADGELRRMTLDEKVGQLIAVGINATFLSQESEAFKQLRRQVEQNHIGGIILFRGSVYESVHLVNRMQQLARRPLLVSADLEAGAGMRFIDTINFPWNMAVGATGNPDYARRMGEVTAREARALGIQQIFAPVVDVNNNAANPVINVRSYGEDPAEVARMAAAFTEGAQRGGVIATAKHFPGHGDTAVDSHRGLPVVNVTRARLDAVELVPFRAAIAAGVGSVMIAHIGLPQLDPTKITPLEGFAQRRPSYTDSEVIVENATLPATLSAPVVGGTLRRDLGFDGIIVTDAMDMSGLTIYFTPGEAAVRAVSAGADMVLKPADTDAAIRGLREAVAAGRLTEKRIEESARRLLAAKYDLGLVRQRIAPIEDIDRVVSSDAALKLSDEIAERAVTLVRDEAGLLPVVDLPPGERIFVLGITNEDNRLWIMQPFAGAFGGRKLEGGVLDDRSPEKEVDSLLDRAKAAKLIIVAMYGRVRSGQSNSGTLPEPGARALKKLLERKVPVVAVSFGNPYLLQSFPDIKTYVVAYGDMPSLQRAAARALLGEIGVSGKLPISLPSLYARGTGIQLKAQAKQVEGNASSSK